MKEHCAWQLAKKINKSCLSQLLFTCCRIYHNGAWLVKIYCFSVDNIVYEYQGSDCFIIFCLFKEMYAWISKKKAFSSWNAIQDFFSSTSNYFIFYLLKFLIHFSFLGVTYCNTSYNLPNWDTPYPAIQGIT